MSERKERASITMNRTDLRLLELDPNRGSEIKLYRYALVLSHTFEIGDAGSTTVLLERSPMVSFRPQKLVANVPWPGVFYLRTLYAADVTGLISQGRYKATDMPVRLPGSDESGFRPKVLQSESDVEYDEEDLFSYNPSATDTLDLPFLKPINLLSASVRYSGNCPPSLTIGRKFTLSLSFRGSATIV